MAEFTGAIPPAQVAQFFNGLVPSEADRLAGSSDEADLASRARDRPAPGAGGCGLGRILIARGDTDEAVELLGAFEGDFTAAGLLARARLTGDPDLDLAAAFAAWDEGRIEDALNDLQETVAADDGTHRDDLRRVMVAIFTELGPESELARDHRRRLALALT